MKPTLRDVNSKPGLHTSEPYPKIHTGGSSPPSASSPGGDDDGDEEEEEEMGEDDDDDGGGGSGRPGHSGSRFMAAFRRAEGAVNRLRRHGRLVRGHAPPAAL